MTVSSPRWVLEPTPDDVATRTLAAELQGWAQEAADDVADFYRGKRINLIVSYGTGGGYDVYARVLAKYMKLVSTASQGAVTDAN